MSKYKSDKIYIVEWNLQIEYIDKFAYDIIYQSLKDCKDEYLEINKLINMINTKSNDISLKYKNKKKTLLNYFKIEKKGLIRFIDNYINIYGYRTHSFLVKYNDSIWNIPESFFLTTRFVKHKVLRFFL